MRRLLVVMTMSIGLLLLAGEGGYALQISQIEFDLHQAAGSTATHSFKVINNESQGPGDHGLSERLDTYLNGRERLYSTERYPLALPAFVRRRRGDGDPLPGPPLNY
jgi:hypothetical protein